MNLLQRVRQEHHDMTTPKAISHHPELAGREHVYRQGANQIVQAMDDFADYGTVYASYAWVQKAIAKIAENLAGLPVRVVDRNDKPLAAHPITELFAYVNDEQTPLDLWSGYTIHMMLGGEGPLQLVPDTKGRPVEVWGRRPDRLAVVPDASRLAYPTALGYIIEPDDTPADVIAVEARHLVHDRFYNPLNPWRGLAPISAVREGITIDLFAQGWSKKFFRNSTRPDFAIVAPQGITPSEKNRYEEQFLRDHQGIEKAHLPVILEEGVTDIKTFSFAPKDLEWLEQRRFSRDEVGAIFGVPDEIMGYGKDTYENFQTALEVFWTLTMLPFIRRRDTTLTHHLTRYNLGLRPGERLDTDLSEVGVLQEDMAPKTDLARKYWEMGVPYNLLDKTLKLGMGPIPGGDVGYLAGTYKPVDQILNPPEPPPLPGLPPADDGDKPAADDAAQAASEPKQEAYVPEPQTVYLLPDGAKEQAKRALKKLIQAMQDYHLRGIREGYGWRWIAYDTGEIERWLGADGKNGILVELHRTAEAIQGDHDAVNAAYNALKSDASLTRLLEVAAPTFFPVELPPGPITPDVYKALLQLDPDDDEAEQAVRMELERRMARELRAAFQEQLAALLPDGADDALIRAAVNRVSATSEPVREVLRRNLAQSASLGVTVALDTLQGIGYGFDWTLAHTEAARWASQYSYELIGGINATTAARMQVAVDDWFNERTTLPDLVREVQPVFGRRRAQLIAQTETTRAAAEGSVTGYEQSGVVQEAEWYTVRDERVCPICGALHGQRAPLRGTFSSGQNYPPAHPGCRCFVRPVIAESGTQAVADAGEGAPAPAAAPRRMTQPQGTPVSGALRLPGSGKYKPIYAEALTAIDAVHGDGTLDELPIITKSSMDAYGHYRYYRTGKPLEIAINGKGDHHQLTLVHEVGHWLDHQAIGPKGTMASERDPTLDAWRQAVDNSAAVERLRDKRRNPSNHRTEIEVSGRKFTVAPDPQFTGYLLDRRELWARSYSQYIAQRSGNAAMLAQVIRETDDPMYGDRQWSDEDFAPIAAAIDALFRGLGWLQ